MPKNPKISEFIDFVPVNIKLAGWIPKRVKSGFFAKNPSRWGGLVQREGSAIGPLEALLETFMQK
jgi:hypothetical protein